MDVVIQSIGPRRSDQSERPIDRAQAISESLQDDVFATYERWRNVPFKVAAFLAQPSWSRSGRDWST